MAVDLGGGRQYAIPQQIPKLKEGASEPFLIRPAVEADLPFLAACYRQGRDRWLLSADWDEDLLRYELLGKHHDNVNRVDLEVIERQTGEAVGFFTHPAFLLGSPERTAVTYLELLPGTSWYAAVPAVMRYMVRLGQQMAATEKKERLDAVELHLGPEHPAYEVLAYQCTADPRPYTWYLRVPDLPRFINFVAPALERRLAGSLCPGYSGTLDISFYRGSGLRLTLENGQLSAAPVSRYWEDGVAAFPGLTFLQLLFGYRSLAELRATYPDCWFDRELEPVFNALFPRRTSLVWPVS